MQPSEGNSVPPRLIFYRDYVTGPLRLWTPLLGHEVLLSGSERQSMVKAVDPDTGKKSRQLVIKSHDPQQMYNDRCGPRATEASCAHECDVLWPAILEMR